MVPIVDEGRVVGEYWFNTVPKYGPPSPTQIFFEGSIYTAQWDSARRADDDGYQAPAQYGNRVRRAQ